MQVVCVYSGVSPFEQKLDYVFNIFKNTLNEIGVKVDVLDISKVGIPYYNGSKQPMMENIFSHLKNAQGVIFATTAQRFSINGVMQVFFEHMDYNMYDEFLKNKYCMSLVTSSDNSEYMAGNYINMLVSSLGAINVNNILVGKNYLPNIELSEDIKEMIEKYAEDFYRIVKQNRKLFVSSPLKSIESDLNNFGNVQNNNYQMQNQPAKQGNDNFYMQKDEGKQVRNLTGKQVAGLYQKEVESYAPKQYQSNQNMQETIKTQNNYMQNNFDNNQNSYMQNNFDNNQHYMQNNFDNNQNSYMQNNFNNNQNNYMQNGIDTNQNNYMQNSIDTNKNNYMQNSINTNQNNYVKNNYSNNQRHLSNENDSYNKYNKAQDEEISQIAKLIGKRYEEENNLQRQLTNYEHKVVPSISSLKQKTQSLYHYFQPQIANGLDIVMQVSISGKENFNGFFTIKNGECNYTEGILPSADVTIIADSGVWGEVLEGKCTLQKAFMLGRLKVKGNFVIISKFEQFFKII